MIEERMKALGKLIKDSGRFPLMTNHQELLLLIEELATIQQMLRAEMINKMASITIDHGGAPRERPL